MALIAQYLADNSNQISLMGWVKYSQYKIDRGEAITAIGSTAIIEAAYAEGVIKIVT